jgi:hypothetical protein
MVGFTHLRPMEKRGVAKRRSERRTQTAKRRWRSPVAESAGSQSLEHDKPEKEHHNERHTEPPKDHRDHDAFF